MTRCLLLAFALAVGCFAQDYKAGVARVNITPKEPIWLSGYAARNKPSEGVGHPIWVKALAIEDGKGGRVVFVTADLIGLPRQFTDTVAATLLKKYKLERSSLLFNVSHTHTGPVVWPNLTTMWDLPAAEVAVLRAYLAQLQEAYVQVVEAALGKLEPVRLEYSVGSADFAVNRREFTPNGVKIGVNPQGPTDHSVPVLRAVRPNGGIVAILFGYACHNTTLGANVYQLTGDYAGYAQTELEKKYPGTQA
ncbi:MAG TPA: neutral/alkaline non-lysosomal ceramidase N-terminal domain-containing protein, partial [Bryobacteraceae bacterium]|nr:neutral/alkaline non-lysosomal ceramidase N-terminal domain-containing protein [Bryobacteraceae bacterium]